MPHGHCFFWEPGILWLHVGSDALIALSYFSIPWALLYVLKKRPGFEFRNGILLFSLFILACGTTHVFEIITNWQPWYWIEGILKLVTAGLSLTTVIMLWVKLPHLIRVPKISELQELNAQLQVEVLEKYKAQKALQESNQNLENRVHQRTEELAKAKEEAEAANRAKSAFLANMSHELRTPLTAIIGFSDLLVEDIEQPESKEDVLKIKQSGQHLLSIVNDLLDLARIESQHSELHLEHCLLQVFLDELKMYIEPQLRENKNTFALELAPDLPQSVQTDSSRLKQILINLLSNANKFTSEGSVTLKVYPTPTDVVFEVQDTGIGIPAEHLPHLFSAFYMVDDTSKRVYQGTGLGLAISQRFTDLLEGKISVSSQFRQGSTFKLEIPRVHSLSKSPAFNS